MKRFRIALKGEKVVGDIVVPPSKSISARALLLQALCPAEHRGTLSHLADCDDTRVLAAALNRDIDFAPVILDIEGAGTAMRFLTAYFACRPGCDVLLTGNDRMQRRPIGPLVDALCRLGADITCVGQPGCPPLRLRGRALRTSEVSIDGSLSSQYVSALLMVAPALGGDGLRLHLEGHVASRPYIDMTLALMRQYGVEADWESGNTIVVQPGSYRGCDLTVEADWTAASYWMALQMVALFRHRDCNLQLEGLTHNSIQGDSACTTLLNPWSLMHGEVTPDCAGTPDLIPTLAVAYCLAGRPFRIFGAESLRIKESDRVEALVHELATLGFPLQVKTSEWRGHEEVTLIWDGTRHEPTLDASLGAPVIHTYGDHRMAMAFVPAALRMESIVIEDPDVVSKSYPAFWEDLARIGLAVESV